MSQKELTKETPEDKEQDIIDKDEMIPDYSFLQKIRQLNIMPIKKKEDEYYGFCLES